jgi:hypothetical protein
MKATATLKMAAGCLTAFLALGATAAEISDVVARQR